MHVCVCVCVREREREGDRIEGTESRNSMRCVVANRTYNIIPRSELQYKA